MRGARRRRSVAGRILISYAVVAAVFVAVVVWAVFALRRAGAEAELMRVGYLPLGVAVEDAVASQDNWNTQLNHITTALNPADKEEWFALAIRAGRPRVFDDVSAAVERAFVESRDSEVRRTGVELMKRVREIATYLQEDREPLAQLFVALDRGDTTRAEALRDELVRRGNLGMKQLRGLRDQVTKNVDRLLEEARKRELLAIQLFIALAALAGVIAVLMAFRAQRVLRPLSRVTDRAKAVADGDLTPREVVDSNDEIGEFAQTFESMVAAIARTSAELVRTERLAAVGTMAARVTHEIRNPLSSMALNIELLEEEVGSQDEAASLVRAIQAEVERLSALSDQYLSLARQQPLRPVEANLSELVQTVAETTRGELARHGVELALQLAEGAPTVRVDAGQIRQVLLNLIRNARESMPAGGTVTVAVEASSSGDGVDISVRDEGEGIPDSVRRKLFQPFFTTKARGTGLGLAITRQIIEAHRGTVRCEPASPRGVRFVVELPCESSGGSKEGSEMVELSIDSAVD